MTPLIALLPILQPIFDRVIAPLLEQALVQPQTTPEKAKEITDSLKDVIIRDIAADPALAPKPLAKSRQFWLGLLTAAGIPALMYLQGIDWTEFFPVYIAVALSGILSIVVRLLTTKPATLY